MENMINQSDPGSRMLSMIAKTAPLNDFQLKGIRHRPNYFHVAGSIVILHTPFRRMVFMLA